MSAAEVFPAVLADPTLSLSYLQDLYGSADRGWFSLFFEDVSGQPHVYWHAHDDLEGVANRVTSAADAGQTLYVGTGLREKRLSGNRRGGNDDVIGIPGFYQDVDVHGPGHKRSDLPPNLDVARQIVREAIPLAPSVEVGSGGGFYPGWILSEVWYFDEAAERKRAASVLDRLYNALLTAMQQHGYHMDNTSDLARVLKIPGSLNLKAVGAPRPVTLLEEIGPRYTVDEIEEVLPEIAADVRASRDHVPSFSESDILLADDERLTLINAMRTAWTDGARHNAAVGLAGYCANAGISEPDALRMVGELSQDDRKPADRAKATHDTYTRARAGGRVSGYHFLKNTVGMKKGNLDQMEQARASFRERAEPKIIRLTAKKSSAGSNGTHDGAGDGAARGNRTSIFAQQGDLTIITAEAWAALEGTQEARRLFRLGGDPIRVDMLPDAPPQATVLGHDDLRLELAESAWFWKYVKLPGGEKMVVAAYPPDVVIKQVRAIPNPPLRSLHRIVSTPVFGADGSLETEPGYHAGGRLFYAPEAGFSVPAVSAEPSATEIASALALIDELLWDFPFASPANRANAIGELVLPFAHDMIGQATPIHIHTAPKPRTGKDLLAEVIAIVGTGQEPSTLTYTADDQEMQKRLTARLRTLPQVVLIPNVGVKVDNGAFCDAVTRGFFENRILGRSEIVSFPAPGIWQMSANNLTMTDELTERSIEIRQDANLEQPGARDPQTFRHHPLKAWARAHRGELVWACLTLVQAWVAAGRVPWKERARGGFEAWSEIIGGIVTHAGLPDFLGNIDETRQSVSQDDEARSEFVRQWWAEFGVRSVRTSELYTLTKSINGLFEAKSWDDRVQATEFGHFLPKLRDAIYVGRKIVLAGKRNKANTFALRPIDGSGFDPQFTGRGQSSYSTHATDDETAADEPGRIPGADQ